MEDTDHNVGSDGNRIKQIILDNLLIILWPASVVCAYVLSHLWATNRLSLMRGSPLAPFLFWIVLSGYGSARCIRTLNKNVKIIVRLLSAAVCVWGCVKFVLLLASYFENI